MPTDRPRICIVTPEYPPRQWGGLARTVGKVARHCASLGYECRVAHLIVDAEGLVLLDENRQTFDDDGVEVHELRVGKEHFGSPDRELWDCPHTLTIRMMYQSLEMLHREFDFDLFISFFLYPIGYVTGLIARRFAKPSIVCLVGNDVKKYVFSPEKVAVCRSGLENAGRVVGLSTDLVDMANALTAVREKSVVIYNSVDIPAEYRQPPESPDRIPVIGCGGIFKYAKGLPYLFKAVADVSKRYDVRLSLVGEIRAAEKPVFDEMLARTGIRGLTDFTGALPPDRVGDWLRSLDVFVLPSLSEGCPNILMEAMAGAVPCIASRTGAVEDLIEDGVSGVIVPPGNSAAIAAALERTIAHSDEADAMGAAARDRMRLFSPGRERAAWASVVESALGSPHDNAAQPLS